MAKKGRFWQSRSVYETSFNAFTLSCRWATGGFEIGVSRSFWAAFCLGCSRRPWLPLEKRAPAR